MAPLGTPSTERIAEVIFQFLATSATIFPRIPCELVACQLVTSGLTILLKTSPVTNQGLRAHAKPFANLSEEAC